MCMYHQQMSKGPGMILRRILLGVCIIQVLITGYLALCIFNSAYSTVKDMKKLPQMDTKRQREHQQQGHGKKVLGKYCCAKVGDI